MEENKTLIKNFIDEIWHNRNVDKISTFWDDDYTNHSMPPEMQKGMENLKMSHQMFLSAFSDLKLEVLDQIAEDNKVVSRLKLSGKHTGDFMGMPSTDKSFQMTGIRIDRIENGKIVEHWADYDMAGLMRQLS